MHDRTNRETEPAADPAEATSRDWVRAVQQDIEAGVSIYDERFRHQRARFGERFVHEYLSEVAAHMAIRVVRAFEAHDRKQYYRCGRAFGTVYTFLFPVPAADAHMAGAGYALALKYHDVIEDGLEAVAGEEPIVAEEADAVLPRRVHEILTHPYWNAVLFGFELLVDALELPYGYAEAQTEFFRYHTAAHEARDQLMVPLLEEIALEYAALAQTIKFGTLVEDPAVVEVLAERYLEAVHAHDAHTRAAQDENIGRMAVVYDRILAENLDVAPLWKRIAERPRRVRRDVSNEEEYRDGVE